jgi:hypothetical protein
METLAEHVHRFLLHFLIVARVEHFGGEGVDEEGLSAVMGDAACPKVEERILVELAGRGAVRAGHVVRIDLELGFGVDRGLIAEQDVPVRLVGIDLLGIAIYVDLSVENPFGPVIEDPFVELVGVAVRLQVVHHGMVVHVLFSFLHDKPVHERLAVLSVHVDLE